ncbi:MAG: hypothetical protein R2845_07090 [Thermomicrobiales bacterium]
MAAREVRLVWKLRRTFAPAHGVPLAILNEDNTCPPPPFARPHMRPLARPTVGHGVVQLTSRDFSPWIEFYNNEPMQLGWQFEIDTELAVSPRLRTTSSKSARAFPIHRRRCCSKSAGIMLPR